MQYPWSAAYLLHLCINSLMLCDRVMDTETFRRGFGRCKCRGVLPPGQSDAPDERQGFIVNSTQDRGVNSDDRSGDIVEVCFTICSHFVV